MLVDAEVQVEGRLPLQNVGYDLSTFVKVVPNPDVYGICVPVFHDFLLGP